MLSATNYWSVYLIASRFYSESFSCVSSTSFATIVFVANDDAFWSVLLTLLGPWLDKAAMRGTSISSSFEKTVLA